jgi:LSD1 subclass zinc finger protein
MEALLKCQSCRGLIDDEDLFCANCGTEAPRHGQPGAQPGTHVAAHSFECKNCRAQMSYDAGAQSLRCPYCDSVDLESKPGKRVLTPSRVVPFALGRDQAVAAMKAWLGRGFWRPGDLAASAKVDAMTAVYVPYWMFRATTKTYYTADSSRTPPGARGDWFPVFGTHQGQHAGLLVPASSVLSLQETEAISPFPLEAARPPAQISTAGSVVEEFQVHRKYARPIARRGIEARETAACRQYVPGNCRNLRVNVLAEDVWSEPIMMPVWVMAYRYRDKVYRFLANGQTAQATGQAPISAGKIIVAVALSIAALIAVAILIGHAT